MFDRPLIRRALLALIVLLALAARLRGNMYGLPHRYAPDEKTKVEAALAYEEGDFQHNTDHPAFLINLLFLTNQITSPLEPLITSTWPRLADTLAEGGQLHFHIWTGRCLIAVLGAATAALVYLLGLRLRGPRTGLLAALLFAINPVSVAVGNNVKEDTPLGLTATAALLACLAVVEGPTRRRLAVMGLLAGVAFGSKYAGIFALAAALVAIALAKPLPAEGTETPVTRRRAVGLTLGFFVAGFFLACPTMLLQLGRLIEGIEYQIGYLGEGLHGEIAISPWESLFTYHLRHALWPGVTPPVLLAGIAGLALLWRADRRRGGLLIFWVVGYYLIIEGNHTISFPYFHRYFLPVITVLCAAAAFALALLWDRARAQRSAGLTALAFALAIGLTGWPAFITARHLWWNSVDTRDWAAAWLEANLPEGAIVLDSRYSPPVDETQHRVLDLSRQSLALAEASSPEQAVYVILSSLGVDRYREHPEQSPFEIEMLDRIEAHGELVAEFSVPPGSFAYHNPDLRVYRVR